jgi:transcriptional regulator with XRE-family HTH domain
MGEGDMAKSKSGYGRGTGKPHPVDVHVGARVKTRRTLLGMTQTDLSDAIGLTFQQVQKYEKGTNRIGAGRLYDLSQVLDVPIDYFFEDMPPAVAASSPAKRRGRAKQLVKYDLDPMAKRETLGLVRAYYKIRDPQIRLRVRELTEGLGASDA